MKFIDNNNNKKIAWKKSNYTERNKQNKIFNITFREIREEIAITKQEWM